MTRLPFKHSLRFFRELHRGIPMDKQLPAYLAPVYFWRFQFDPISE